MQLAPIVAKHIQEVVRGNWTDIYLEDTIADVAYTEAVALPAGISNSIATLLNHLIFYNDVVLERLKGNDPLIDCANGFDPKASNEEEWQQLKVASIDCFKRLADFVKKLPDEKLWELTPGGTDTCYKTLHGISEHAHYHLGQIVLLKKIIKNHAAIK